MRVIASSIRKGNIVEHEDGQLYAVLTAESFHPGKGTPTTTIDMRRISDGVKTQVRYKTTEQVERAFVEDANFSYLYSDGDGNHFMNEATFDQVPVGDDVLADYAGFLRSLVDLSGSRPLHVVGLLEQQAAQRGQVPTICRDERAGARSDPPMSEPSESAP